MKTCILLIIILLSSTVSSADLAPDQLITYKTINGVALKLHVFNPPNHKVAEIKPAVVFFFGGGWLGGTPTQFYKQSAYFASRGMVAISAEYRVERVHGTSPREAVKDGKSAIRWVRTHAKQLGIDSTMIAAGGGSAGGHVAAATAVLAGFNELAEDASISSSPNALILFNPVIDNGPTGYGHSRVKEYWEEFSPIHNIGADAPPTIMFLGTRDELIPVATVKEYKRRMNDKGRRCDLFLYKDQTHGFFNAGKKHYDETLLETQKFLTSLGFL